MDIVNKTIFDDSQSNIGNGEDLLRKVREELCAKETDTEEDIIRNLNIAYLSAIDYLKTRLYYNPSTLGKAGKYTFKSLNDVITFLDQTRNKRGKIYCTIVKLTISHYNTDPKINQEIASVIDKTNNVIAGKMIPGLQIQKKYENGDFSGIVALEDKPGIYRVIPFSFSSRLKSQESMVGKEIRDPKYFLLENLSDIYGGKFFLKKREDILPFSQYIAGIVFKKGVFDIKDRGMFSDEEIKTSPEIHEDFREKCIHRQKDKKKISSDNMRDWRLVSPFKKDDEVKKLSLEIGFVLDNGENEAGLTSQYIYSFLRKIDEVIRLDQYIFPEHLEDIVKGCIGGLSNEEKEDIFRELRDKKGLIGKNILLRNNKHARANIDTYISPALTEYFIQKSGVIEIRKKGWRMDRIAFSNHRQINLYDFSKIPEDN